MIAQGDFLKLLLADTKSRQEIFREIFKTRYYMVFQERMKGEAGKLQRDCEAARASVQQYIGGVVCQEDDLSKPTLEKAQAGELPFADTVELIQELIRRDREARNVTRAARPVGGRTKGDFSPAGQGGGDPKTREKLEATCRPGKSCSPDGGSPKTLEKQQQNVPRQEELSRKLSVLKAELLGIRNWRRRRMPALP